MYQSKGKINFDEQNKTFTDSDNETPKSHLSQQENIILTTILCLFSGYSGNNENTKDHHKMTQYAFGVSKSTHKQMDQRFVTTDGTMALNLDLIKD